MVFPSRKDLSVALSQTPSGQPLPIDADDCPLLLEASALNVILSKDSFTKTIFVAHAIRPALRQGAVLYVDLDTIFTAFLDLMVEQGDELEDLTLLTPDDEDAEEALAFACSPHSPHLKLVILDSITTLYHLLNKEGAPFDPKLKINTYLSLLRSLATRLKLPIIVTSMTRAKEARRAPTSSWIVAPTGGRALMKSEVILKVGRVDDALQIEVVKHNVSALMGRTFNLPLMDHLRPT